MYSLGVILLEMTTKFDTLMERAFVSFSHSQEFLSSNENTSLYKPPVTKR